MDINTGETSLRSKTSRFRHIRLGSSSRFGLFPGLEYVLSHTGDYLRFGKTTTLPPFSSVWEVPHQPFSGAFHRHFVSFPFLQFLLDVPVSTSTLGALNEYFPSLPFGNRRDICSSGFLVPHFWLKPF